jgi:molybdopterin-guanine dinucleotide biosynthesis protein B
MKVLSVFGVTNSGKTTTVENIIKELKSRGYSVGSVKEIHYEAFTIDCEGTDTSRHMAAGAELITARGFYETDILYKAKLPIDDILRHYTQDFVVLEGVRDAKVPKIICAHNESEICERLDDSIFAISGVISNTITDFKGLPVISAAAEIKRLVDLIEAKVGDYSLGSSS